MGDEVAAPEPPETRAFGSTTDGWRRRRRSSASVVVASIVAAGLLWSSGHVEWLQTQPGGPAFFVHVRPIGTLALVFAALIALVRPTVGACVAAFTTGAVGAFGVHQLVGWSAAVVIAVVAAPALVASALTPGARRRRIRFGSVVVALAVVGAVVGERTYQSRYGPTHPESVAVPVADGAVRWVWSGGVTSAAAEIRARTDADPSATVELAVVDVERSVVRRLAAVDRGNGVVAFSLDDLRADAEHRYSIEIDGVADPAGSGSFRTFPAGPASFSFTVGGCARVGSNGAVFDAVLGDDPLFHVITGDLHYGDIDRDDREHFDEVIDLTLRQPAQAALYRETPIAYVWDDHDYGPNDSDAASPSRPAAMAAYRANVPSYALVGPDTPVYQRFDVGRVRFLVTDSRAGRVPGETMLGAPQLAWFLDELVAAAREQALVVWVNPVPWVADADPGADHWGGFAAERRMIAEHIVEHDIDNLVMLSGDAHMVAVDDGTNTQFADVDAPGFPLLHAAALDRPGSVKGGPYSHGAIGGGGQYGLVEVHDDGSRIRVELHAKRFDGEVLLSYAFDVEP